MAMRKCKLGSASTPANLALSGQPDNVMVTSQQLPPLFDTPALGWGAFSRWDQTRLINLQVVCLQDESE